MSPRWTPRPAPSMTKPLPPRPSRGRRLIRRRPSRRLFRPSSRITGSMRSDHVVAPPRKSPRILRLRLPRRAGRRAEPATGGGGAWASLVVARRCRPRTRRQMPDVRDHVAATTDEAQPARSSTRTGARDRCPSRASQRRPPRLPTQRRRTSKSLADTLAEADAAAGEDESDHEAPETAPVAAHPRALELAARRTRRGGPPLGRDGLAAPLSWGEQR